MPGVSQIEKPPGGLKMPFLQTWRDALRAMKEQGTWAPELRPLLDEYVYALRGAEDARNGFAWLDNLEHAVASEDVDWMVLRQIAGGLPAAWDKHTKRAAALADQLCLTPRGRKVLGKQTEGDGDDGNPFAGLDELAPRRERAQAS